MPMIIDELCGCSGLSTANGREGTLIIELAWDFFSFNIHSRELAFIRGWPGFSAVNGCEYWAG